MSRRRPIYIIAMLTTIALGLLSRRFPHLLPSALGKYPGDALWALMVFLGFGFLFRCSPTIIVAAAAFAFSVAIEFSQLYRAPWIDSIRDTFAGHLVLGKGFAWTDILAYAVGILLGAAAELVIFCRWKSKNAGSSWGRRL